MCGCDCGGGVVIQCGGAVGGQTPPQTGGGTNPPPSSPKPEPPCKVAVVRFESLHVTNSGALVSLFDEDWNVFLEVNGGGANIGNPLSTQDDTRFTFGASAEVTVPMGVDTVIKVTASGVFNPNSLIEGPLPSKSRSHGSADNWGLGGSFTLEASNRDRSYEVAYSIDCLTQEVASLASREALVDALRGSLSTLRQKPKIPDDAALSAMLAKLGRHGFRVRSLQGTELLLEGPTDVHSFLKRLAPRKSPRHDK